MTKSRKKPAKMNLEESLVFVEDLKQRWMATVDAIADPLMIVGRDYKILKSNRSFAAYGGNEIKEVIGQKCHKVLADRDLPCPGCEVAKVFAEPRAKPRLEFENIIRGKYHEASLQPIFDGSGTLEGVLAIYRDRSEAKELQDKLLQTEKMASIGLLAGGIAHEINNPLGGILIFSQMMLREMDEDNAHYADVVEIEAAAQRCKGIIQNLLDFARAQPVEDLDIADVDVQDAMLSALHFVMVGNNRREIRIIEAWDDKRLTFRGNQNKLIQAFLNLIQNAVQAMPRGGVLTLSSQVRERRGAPWMCYIVEDTGVGIEASQITKVFDPFYTSKEPGEGTGLGLSICHGIIQDMGGEIDVSSTVGESTVFRIYLPLARGKEVPQSA